MEYRCNAAVSASLSAPNLEISCDDKRIIPVVPARGRAEVALGWYYAALFIYRTCMRSALTRPVHPCFVRTCCTVLVQDVQEHHPHTTTLQCNAKRHFVLQRSCLKVDPSHFTLHLTSSHFLFSPLLISSSKFFSTIFISADNCSTSLISWKLFWIHLSFCKYFPVLLCTAKLAESTFQYYFVFVCFCMFLYYKTCTPWFSTTTLYNKWVRLVDGEQWWLQTSGGRGSLWCLYAELVDKKS